MHKYVFHRATSFWTPTCTTISLWNTTQSTASLPRLNSCPCPSSVSPQHGTASPRLQVGHSEVCARGFWGLCSTLGSRTYEGDMFFRCQFRPCGCPAAMDHSEYDHPVCAYMCSGGDYLSSLSLPEWKRTEDPFFVGNVNTLVFFLQTSVLAGLLQ